ncbi:MAG: type VI secretion system secreted protein VgrG [Reinekea sp.]|jgi:type VI secretion system secreted protein VgrG
MVEFENRSAWIKGPLGSNEMMLKNARVREGLSEITEITVEFFSRNREVEIADILGEPVKIEIKMPGDEPDRAFEGMCISVEYIGDFQGLPLFAAELRSPLWRLTQTRDNRVFQEMTTLNIVMEIFADYGLSADITQKLSNTYKNRTYCVQYDETDYDFVMRLFAEEGIYYYTEEGGKVGKIVLTDDSGQHAPIRAEKDLDFHSWDPTDNRADDYIFEWNERGCLTTGKVTLVDYDFKKPSSELKAVVTSEKGSLNAPNEFYHYPMRTRDKAEGEAFTKIRVDAEAVRNQTMRGMGNVRAMQVGFRFDLKKHPRESLNQEYLTTRAVHFIEVDSDYDDNNIVSPTSIGDSKIESDDRFKRLYRCEFEVIPAETQYRAQFIVPWPKIAGVQTAIVVGPSGEEINVDENGAIQVQFYWDRLGQKDETSSCWIRCAMPWSGKGFGMMAIPRVGQEVVVQFEDGNPDRPICTGMMYNADTTPPYALPANKTQSGIKTRSSKSGSTETFNELMFEDKKDAELVRLQSEKDYVEIIKNSADITIGIEKGPQDGGHLTQTIYGDKKETLTDGNHIFKVETGFQKIEIKGDHSEKIEGKSTQTITGDRSQTIEEGALTQTVTKGDYTQTVSAGDVTRNVEGGNEVLTLSGDYEISSGGQITISASTSITLEVGGSSVVIDSSGVTIKGTTVEMSGTASADVKGPAVTVEASGILTLKGATAMIN